MGTWERVVVAVGVGVGLRSGTLIAMFVLVDITIGVLVLILVFDLHRLRTPGLLCYILSDSTTISSITTGLPRFLFHTPTSPHLLLLLTIWRRCYLRCKDLFHCTFPLVIQGPSSLYDYIGILHDTIYPHTPTSSMIHIGLAYVGLDRSRI